MTLDRSRLTPRELEVLGHLVAGRSNRQIGDALSIGEGTVKGHLHRILRKLNVSNRTEAAVAALRKRAVTEAVLRTAEGRR